MLLQWFFVHLAFFTLVLCSNSFCLMILWSCSNNLYWCDVTLLIWLLVRFYFVHVVVGAMVLFFHVVLARWYSFSYGCLCDGILFMCLLVWWYFVHVVVGAMVLCSCGCWCDGTLFMWLCAPLGFPISPNRISCLTGRETSWLNQAWPNDWLLDRVD